MNTQLEPENLFDPRHYAPSRRPYDTAETLPRWCYTSQAFFERERDRIFLKHWACIGHEDRVPTPGSYVTFSFAGVPTLVVRGSDNRIRAFLNVCRHRGAELAVGAGECRRLKCPYHAWTYALDGTLIGTPMVEESEGFRHADHGLRPIRLEMWGGLMWINFDSDSESLASYLGDLPERTAGWRTEEMICAARTTYRLHANWKLHFENFSDTYHVPFVHRSSLNWKTVARRELHDTAIYKGNYIMHYTLFEGTRGVPEGERAFPFLNLPATFRSGTFFPYVYPGTGMGFSIDSMFVSEIYPEGPDVTTYVRNFLIPKAYTELPHYEEILASYLRGLETVTNEDITVLEAQYRALRSPIYTPGHFTAVDRMVHDCENWVLDRVLDDVAT